MSRADLIPLAGFTLFERQGYGRGVNSEYRIPRTN